VTFMDNNLNTDKKESPTPLVHDSNMEIKDFNQFNLFKKDKNFTFAHQKLEKLSAAVYMITNLFETDEPLKWSLRNLSTELVHLNIALQSDLSQRTTSVESRMREIILEIVSLLDIASFGGLVSSMNVSVIKREFQYVLHTITKITRSRERVNLGLDESFFVVDTLDSRKGNSEIESKYEVVSIKDKTDILEETRSTNQASRSLLYDETHEKSEKLKLFSPVAVKKNKRQSLIITLLKKKKEVMIKDVSDVIRDCSEKTIQRELLSLVEQGILSKVGERRWTKYSLV